MSFFLLNIAKPIGVTSFTTVAQVRRILGIKKVGHMGTLDPFASGVLPIAVGKYTKLIQYLQPAEKEYVAKVRFGATSTTLDPEGEITVKENVEPVEVAQIAAVLPKLIGEVEQLPPIYSALKVGGQRAYNLARQGKEVKLESRKVNIQNIEILDYRWPNLTIKVTCGKGVYIRSIARDLGELLNVGGYLTELTRTRVGQFALAEAQLINDEVSVEQIKQSQVDLLKIWPGLSLSITEAEWQELRHGRFIANDEELGETDYPILGIYEDCPVCLLEHVEAEGNQLKVKTRLVE